MRTSDNAFVTNTTTAMKLKKRCFKLLGVPEYDERQCDGMQVLRYNQTTAYTTHLDYFTSMDAVDQVKRLPLLLPSFSSLFALLN